MKVTKETLKKIAYLARLEVKQEDEKSLLADLNNILGWVDKLNEIDTEGVEPLTHMSSEINSLREDEGNNTLDKSAALDLAPEHNDEFFKVPKVIKNK